MKIAIIGTGNVGQALGKSFTRAGHDVTYAARDAKKTKDTAASIGASAAAEPADAIKSADLAVLAVPYTACHEVSSEIIDAARGKIVIDATNPLNPDFSGLATEGTGTSAAEQIASWMPGARIVKAFNTLFAAVQGNPQAHGVTIDALYATDDEEARDTVAELLRSMGFRPVYVGQLARARELEALAWLNMQLQMSAQGSWTTAINFVGAPEAAVSVGTKA